MRVFDCTTGTMFTSLNVGSLQCFVLADAGPPQEARLQIQISQCFKLKGDNFPINSFI